MRFSPQGSVSSLKRSETSEDKDGVSAGPFSMVPLVLFVCVFVCGEG